MGGQASRRCFQRKHLLEPRPVADRQLEHVEEPARRELGVDEVVGQVGAPLIEPGAVEHVIAGRLVGVEQVSVRIVLVLLAPGIAPVVEDLAAEQMPADAPGVAVPLRHQDLLAHLDRVEVDDLEGDMVDLRFEASRDEQRVMVARLVAAVEAHERPDRGSVLKAHHVRRKEAERVHIPAGAAVEIGRLEHEVAELRHLRRRQRRTLGVVDADRLVRSIVGNGRANRLRRDRSEAVMDADRDPQRVDEAYDGARRPARRPFRRNGPTPSPAY